MVPVADARVAAAALIVAGLITGVMAKPDQSAFPEQPAFQPVIMASMAPHVVLSPASTVLSPVSTSLGTAAMPAAMSQPDMAIPELPEQMPGTPVSSTNASIGASTGASTGAGSTALPEPASLDLLGFCVLGPGNGARPAGVGPCVRVHSRDVAPDNRLSRRAACVQQARHTLDGTEQGGREPEPYGPEATLAAPPISKPAGRARSAAR